MLRKFRSNALNFTFLLVLRKILQNLSKIPIFAVICTSFDCGKAASAKFCAIFRMFCQVTAEDCVDLRSITTLLSMMSQYFSDCDKLMRCVADTLLMKDRVNPP